MVKTLSTNAYTLVSINISISPQISLDYYIHQGCLLALYFSILSVYSLGYILKASNIMEWRYGILILNGLYVVNNNFLDNCIHSVIVEKDFLDGCFGCLNTFFIVIGVMISVHKIIYG